jgi:hypothetical protein
MMAATGPTGAGARASLPHGFDRRGRDHRAAAMGWARRASKGNSKIAFRQCKRRAGFAGCEPQTEGLGYYVMAIRESAYPPRGAGKLSDAANRRACGSMAVPLPPIRRRDLRAAGRWRISLSRLSLRVLGPSDSA